MRLVRIAPPEQIMSKVKPLLLLVLVIIAVVLIDRPAFAKIYKWKDSAGKVHYTDSAQSVPGHREENSDEIVETASDKKPSVALTAAQRRELRIKGQNFLTGKDYQSAYKAFEKLAKDGDPWGEYNFGHLFWKGSGVRKDESKAFKWYKKSAEGGYAQGKFFLGMMYEKGKGTKLDYGKALYWYKQASDGGNSFAAYRIGLMYHDGRGVKKNKAKAKRWMSLSAGGKYDPAKTLLERWQAESPAKESVKEPVQGAEPDLAQKLSATKKMMTKGAGDLSKEESMAFAYMAKDVMVYMTYAKDFFDDPVDMAPVGYLFLFLSLLWIAGWWKIFNKGGELGFLILIPIANYFPWFKIGGKPAWWFLLLLIPVVGFVVYVITSIAISRNFGRSALYGLGLVFLPFLFVPMLGFGPAKYNAGGTGNPKAIMPI